MSIITNDGLTRSGTECFIDMATVGVSRCMEMQESQELHRNIVKYSIQHIQRVSSPCSNNDAKVHQVLQYYFRFTDRFDAKFEIGLPESRKYTGITCKVN